MLTSRRLTTPRLTRQLAGCAGACVALLGLSAAPALAFAGTPEGCEAQEVSQPFVAFSDFHYYKLAPGGEFNSGAEGWELSGGAQVITSTRPDGSTAGVLDMPGGGQAVSPPMVVTLQDPTARVWVRDAKGAEGVKVAVSYLNTPTATKPKDVGNVHGQQSAWTLANQFNIQPQIAGSEEGPRTVRFVFTAGKSNDTQLYGLWVDPRMRGEGRATDANGCLVAETSSPSASTSQPSGSAPTSAAPGQHPHPHHHHRKNHRPSTGHSPSGSGGSTGTTPSLGGGLTVRGASEGETPVGVH